jgi:hypothetical protein
VSFVALRAIQICAMAMPSAGQRPRHRYFHPRYPQQAQSHPLYHRRMGHLTVGATHVQKKCGVRWWDYSAAENSSRVSWMSPFSKPAISSQDKALTSWKNALLAIPKLVLNRSQLPMFNRQLLHCKPHLLKCSQPPQLHCNPLLRWLNRQRRLQPNFLSSPLSQLLQSFLFQGADVDVQDVEAQRWTN